MRSDARKRQADPLATAKDAEAKAAQLTSLLNDLGFCPTDLEPMPCFTCGAGL